MPPRTLKLPTTTLFQSRSWQQDTHQAGPVRRKMQTLSPRRPRYARYGRRYRVTGGEAILEPLLQFGLQFDFVLTFASAWDRLQTSTAFVKVAIAQGIVSVEASFRSLG